jgi:hypothetical protein
MTPLAICSRPFGLSGLAKYVNAAVFRCTRVLNTIAITASQPSNAATEVRDSKIKAALEDAADGWFALAAQVDSAPVLCQLPDDAQHARWQGIARRPADWCVMIWSARRERPRSRTAEQRDEFALFTRSPPSARASSLSGIFRPSLWAVLRLMTNSNLVGCMTGTAASRGLRRRREREQNYRIADRANKRPCRQCTLVTLIMSCLSCAQ